MVRKTVLLSTIAVGVTLQSLPVAAATEEIIVTARKRQESILKVPVVETVISGKSLEQFGTHDLAQVTARVPGFLLGGAVGSTGVQVSLRGVGTTTTLGTIDQSVSLNIDGLQQSQGLAYRAAMFDLAQVEVLKGPQNLFYGKNSPGGVISLRSNDPTNKYEVILRGGYEFEAKEKVGEIILSGPITDKLKVRVATQYSDQDGYFKNVAVAIPGTGGLTPTSQDLPDTNVIVKGTVLFNPTEWYNMRLKMNYTKDELEHDGFIPQIGACPEGSQNNIIGGIQFNNAAEDCKLDRNLRFAWADPRFFPGIRGGGVPFTDIYQTFGSLEQNLKLGDSGLTLTSVTGLYIMHEDNLINSGANSNTDPAVADLSFGQRQTTEEIRISSDFKHSPVNFMVGTFLQEGWYMSNLASRRSTSPAFLPTFASAINGLSGLTKHTVMIYSRSAFGQVTWNVTPKLELAAGARWTREERTHREDTFCLQGPPGTPRPTGSGCTGAGFWLNIPMAIPKIASDNLSPEFTATYKPTNDMTVFASYKEGFKSGSYNTVTFLTPGTHSEFNDEGVRGIEIGAKARFLDRHLQTNLALYRYMYRDLQVGAQEITAAGQLANRTLNAASAEVKGVDFDIAYQPPQITGLNLFGAVEYNNARYGTFKNAPCSNGQTFDAGCNSLVSATGVGRAQDLSGRPLVRAPDWSVNFGFDYEMPIAGNMTLAIGSATSYTTKFFTGLTDRPFLIQNAYFKTGANVALRGPDDGWEVAFIGNNLTDEITSGQCSGSPNQSGVFFATGQNVQGTNTLGANGDDEALCNADRGRELWLRVTLRPLAMFGH